MFPSRRARALGALRATPRRIVFRVVPGARRRYQQRALQLHRKRIASATRDTSMPPPTLVRRMEAPKPPDTRAG
jgi:hypothetical protein